MLLRHPLDDELHQLAGVHAELVREFADSLGSEQVHHSFTATVAGFNGAPVRHVVPLPAHRVARLELQRRDHDVPGRRRAVTSQRSQSTVSTF